MPDSQGPKSSEAHLARVRDNQRRSRARRKQYLSELEEKFRKCEQFGAEASSEMQVAARKVLEENACLRALLRAKGISDEEMNSLSLPAETLAFGLSNSNPQYPTPAQQLVQQLQEPKRCSPSDCCSGDGKRTSSCGAASSPTNEDENNTLLFSSSMPAAFRKYDRQSSQNSQENLQPLWHIPSAGQSSISGDASPLDYPGDHQQTANPEAPTPHFDSNYNMAWPQTSGTSQGMPHLSASDNLFTPDDSLQVLLSPTRQSRFLRYLGIEPPSTTDNYAFDPSDARNSYQCHSLSATPTAQHINQQEQQQRQQHQRPHSQFSSNAAPSPTGRLSNDPGQGQSWAVRASAYCHRLKSWKKLDDPCWIVCSMLAADVDGEGGAGSVH